MLRVYIIINLLLKRCLIRHIIDYKYFFNKVFIINGHIGTEG